MSKIETDRFAHEKVKRHFIDRQALRTHMSERIDMRAHVIEHADEIRLKGHGVAGHAKILRLSALVAHVHGVDRALKQLVRRHVVFDEYGEIDDTSHGKLLC